MKIAIFSDTHDNIPNFKKAVEWVSKEGIELILHCGDITRVSTLEEALEDFEGCLIGVLGNADIDLEGYQSSKAVVRGEKTEEKIAGELIGFTHFPDIAKKMAGEKKYKFVFYGHTHKPWQEGSLVNPGNLAGLIYKATFAVYDSDKDKLDLKILDK